MEQFGVPRMDVLYAATQRELATLKRNPVISTDYLTSVIYENFAVDLRLNSSGKTEFMEVYRRSSSGLIRIDPNEVSVNAIALPRGEDQPIADPSQLLQLMRP
jgi:hypothetical protein